MGPARAAPADTLPAVLRYVERLAPRALAPFLECLWLASDPEPRNDRPAERIVPDGCPELIVHAGDVFRRRVGSRWVAQPRAFLAGTLTRPWTLRAGRRVLTLGARFRAGAVTALFDLRMADATDRETRLANLAGRPSARRLVERARGAPSPEAALSELERWLAERTGPASRDVPLARRAASLLLRMRGRLRVEELAKRSGCGRRRLERAFASDVGVPPKLFARIVRLNAVLAALGTDGRSLAVEVALETGFFDQAHMLRDFRLLAQRRPRARRDADGELARHFTDPERLRALLAAV